jgi:ABC-2 type transport system permease protein
VKGAPSGLPSTGEQEVQVAVGAPASDAGSEPRARAAARRQTHGPSALGDSLHRFWSLTFMLARTEFKLRFFGSVLGYIWTLMNPLLLFGVMLFVFTQIIQINKHNATPHYAQYLLEGIILFTYFQETTAGAVPSLVFRENILRRVRFPRLTIPLSVSLTSLFNLSLNLVVLFAFIIGDGIGPFKSWLALPLLLFPLVVFATGTGMLLSALYVRFRDIQPIWSVFLQLFYWGSPILYTIETAEHKKVFGLSFARILALNPLGAILTEARKILLQPSAPSAAQAAGGTIWLLIPISIIVGVFVVGLWYFYHEAPLISERL